MTALARVRVGGVYLDTIAPVDGLRDSTIWRLQGYSGDHEAEWTWSAPASFSAPWFRAGATVEVVEGGIVVWRGFLGEPQPSRNSGWSCVAFGDGADAANYLSSDPVAANINTSITDAYARGMRWSNYGNDFTGGTFSLTPGYIAIMLNTALDRIAASQGKVWYVSRGVGDLRSESSAVDWLMAQDSTYLGVTDENYVTSLAAFYVSSVDIDGNPDGWAYTVPSSSTIPHTADDVAAERMGGHREAVVDLTALGQLGSGDAYVMAGARFAQVGARAGFTNGFEMTALNSRSAANLVPAPMMVRAGDRIRIPGMTDMYAATTYGSSVTVTAGKVTRAHKEQRVQVEPVGMVDRDFAGALAAAQKPESQVEEL